MNTCHFCMTAVIYFDLLNFTEAKIQYFSLLCFKKSNTTLMKHFDRINVKLLTRVYFSALLWLSYLSCLFFVYAIILSSPL